MHNRRALSFPLLLNRPAFLRSYLAPKHQLILDTRLSESSEAIGFLGTLIQVIWVGVILLPTMIAAATTFLIAQPNCNKSCANVTIPYPYGKTVGCYLNDHATHMTDLNQKLETLTFQLIRGNKNRGY